MSTQEQTVLACSDEPAQQIRIGDDIMVTVTRSDSNRVQLSIAAPGDVEVVRGPVHAHRSIVREFGPGERERWLQAVAEARAEAPELIERELLTQEPAAEHSVSGQLRRAIRRRNVDYCKSAEQCGLSVRDICEFICGRATLDSDAFSRLSEVCNLQLAQIP